jgi:hypothetical protein
LAREELDYCTGLSWSRNMEGVLVYKRVYNVRFEVFTAVTTKNGVFWDVTPGGSCKNRRFGGT